MSEFLGKWGHQYIYPKTTLFLNYLIDAIKHLYAILSLNVTFI